MFGYRDEISLSINHIINNKGEVLPIDFSLPRVKTVELTDDIVKASLCEVHTQDKYKDYSSYNIYIGEIQTILKLQSDNKKYRITKTITDTDNISMSDLVCCFKEDGDRYVVFAKVNEEDIVVKNIEEFKEMLMDLTTDLIMAQNTIQRVKQHIYKK